MSGTRKFVDVAKEAMGRSSLSKGMGVSDVRIVLEHVVYIANEEYVLSGRR